MKRGELWTAAGGADYAGKPRPVVVVQDDRFEDVKSVTICSLTTDLADAYIFRLTVEATEANGLRTTSRLMADKITTIPKTKLRYRIGKLSDADLERLNEAIIIFLGLAG